MEDTNNNLSRNACRLVERVESRSEALKALKTFFEPDTMSEKRRLHKEFNNMIVSPDEGPA